jgi:phage tail sheath protein FI
VPEYLAPGVYVEETSFRSKSIEGVSTSTSAFAGPARKGPIGGKPVFVTSFAEFERIYGGFANLGIGINYLAHGVRAYFDNGGSRLYISRVYSPKPNEASAASSLLSPAGQPNRGVSFKARFPGTGLNGSIQVALTSSPATKAALERAPVGTFIRTGAGDIAAPAILEGGLAPYFVEDNSRLTLLVAPGNADASITFSGKSAEIKGQDNLAANIDILAADAALTTIVGGVRQVVTFPVGNTTPGAIVDIINTTLRGGYARIDAGKLVIGCDRRGRSSSISVEPNAKLGITAALQADNANQAAMLSDLNAVSIPEINLLLSGANIKVRASASPAGRLQLSSIDSGETVGITVQAAGTAARALGLPTAVAAKGKKGSTPGFYLKRGNDFVNAQNVALNMAELDPKLPPNSGVEILALAITAEDAEGLVTAYEGIAVGAEHPRYLGNILTQKPTRRSDELSAPYYAEIAPNTTAFELFEVLASAGGQRVMVQGGSDGNEPSAIHYKAAISAFEDYEDISIVATPGGSSYTDAQAIMLELIGHTDVPRRYRVAVVDTPRDLSPDQARELRGKADSTRAAMYFPWVVISNPLFRPGADNQARELTVPPSGFIAGIYARNDIERSVAKAPANEIVRGALRFESDINFATQEVLNPLGINCLRALTGRGYRVWGARTMSSDPEWKYVNVRRYFHFLEASIDRGTQWSVFENNGERLWENIRETVEGFLYNEWISGNLLGESPEQAYFVRCDRTTMTQNDLDNGRLICLIGVAALKPAEFVIFRIGQKTVDANN